MTKTTRNSLTRNWKSWSLGKRAGVTARASNSGAAKNIGMYDFVSVTLPRINPRPSYQQSVVESHVTLAASVVK
jgi:hypothetical protein